MSVIVDEVTVSFQGREVLTRVCATFPSHTFTVLTGPSGSGKTTLMSVIGGVLSPQSGSVLVNGYDPHPGVAAWVPQGANALPSRSLLDNVMIAPLSDGRSRDEAVETARLYLEMVGLGNREKSLARELSGGELQRLSLARGLASNRPLLLADEPTASLDHATAFGMIDLLQRVPVERTMIIATHDPELINAAELVVDLRDLHTRSTRADSVLQL